jgi:aspartyl-tRNA(Asn)/glutamyl-tRNA(Gln) amidotransferase subunit A
MTGIQDKLEMALQKSSATHNVFTQIYEDAARQEARAADERRRRGDKLSLIDGKIVSVKDLFDVAGYRTLAGSRALESAPKATADAEIVATLRRAGAIVIGKTSMSEFAFSGLGLNNAYGSPANVFDPERVPGGSSSGAAVAVALDCCEISIGTDTAGSVRIPAALNGVTGFKPSSGKLATAGSIPLSYTLDVVGPVAKTVGLCSDSYRSLSASKDSPTDLDLSSIRFARPVGRLFNDLHSDACALMDLIVERIVRANGRVVDVDVDDLLQRMFDSTSFITIGTVEAGHYHSELFRERAELYDARMRKRLEVALKYPAVGYIDQLRTRDILSREMTDRLAKVDVLLSPTVRCRAPLISDVRKSEELYAHYNLLIQDNTSFANYFNFPSISISHEDYQMCGIMVSSLSGSDEMLLGVAGRIEKETQ